MTEHANTAQQLNSLIKAARKTMRQDKGLSTDLDRLPMLTWLMFLKFLDDLEQTEEAKAKLRGAAYRPTIDPPYRWRDWASRPDGITGAELIDFVGAETTVLPNQVEGPGLLRYLRSLEATDNGVGRRRAVIATVFAGVENKIRSGYLLRDVVNDVAGIHFTSREELFTLGHIYESMLREMRDAAGDNGEFYTPRPVVKFIVDLMRPELGETVLDPACGTGGFLVEVYSRLEASCHTVEDRERLQNQSLFGGEAKPLPYLLCQMNLLLHGLEAPSIDPGNSLRHRLSDIGKKDRVDVIVTNPPFGGEEEPGILGNFPPDMQTSETALLFLQLIMQRLRRPASGVDAGRAAVIVPNGTLFGDGIAARIKYKLLQEFNLHTIVRLPEGAFAPYTDIATNILFFNAGGPTGSIWYYSVAAPPGKKRFSKTTPVDASCFEECVRWWSARTEGEHAWRVNADDIVRLGDKGEVVAVDLDLQNPLDASTKAVRPVSAVLDDIAAARCDLERELDLIDALAREWY